MKKRKRKKETETKHKHRPGSQIEIKHKRNPDHNPSQNHQWTQPSIHVHNTRMQASKFFPLASWMVELSLSTWKSLTKTNSTQPMSSTASFSRLNCFFLLMLLLWCFMRGLTELRKWDREIEWIASLSLSRRSQIFSVIASISSNSRIYLRLYDAPLGSEVCVWFIIKYKKIWVLSFEFGGRKSRFEFSVWGPKIWIGILCLMF